MPTRTERVESTKCFEMQCREDGGRWLVQCDFVFGYSSKRRKLDSRTCTLRPGVERFNAWGGEGDREIHPVERHCCPTNSVCPLCRRASINQPGTPCPEPTCSGTTAKP